MKDTGTTRNRAYFSGFHCW